MIAVCAVCLLRRCMGKSFNRFCKDRARFSPKKNKTPINERVKMPECELHDQGWRRSCRKDKHCSVWVAKGMSPGTSIWVAAAWTSAPLLSALYCFAWPLLDHCCRLLRSCLAKEGPSPRIFLTQQLDLCCHCCWTSARSAAAGCLRALLLDLCAPCCGMRLMEYGFFSRAQSSLGRFFRKFVLATQIFLGQFFSWQRRFCFWTSARPAAEHGFFSRAQTSLGHFFYRCFLTTQIFLGYFFCRFS